MRTAQATRLTDVNLIQNWFEELKAKFEELKAKVPPGR